MTSEEAIANAAELLKEAGKGTGSPQHVAALVQVAHGWMALAQTIKATETP